MQKARKHESTKARKQTRIESGQEGFLSGFGPRVSSGCRDRVRVLCASLVQVRVGLVCPGSSRLCLPAVREGERHERQSLVIQGSCSAAANGDAVRQVGTGLFNVHFARGPVRQQLPAERHVPYYSCTQFHNSENLVWPLFGTPSDAYNGTGGRGYPLEGSYPALKKIDE